MEVILRRFFQNYVNFPIKNINIDKLTVSPTDDPLEIFISIIFPYEISVQGTKTFEGVESRYLVWFGDGQVIYYRRASGEKIDEGLKMKILDYLERGVDFEVRFVEENMGSKGKFIFRKLASETYRLNDKSILKDLYEECKILVERAEFHSDDGIAIDEKKIGDIPTYIGSFNNSLFYIGNFH